MARNEGFKYWSDQEFVQGFDTNAYLMSQSVMRFDNSADRDSALARTLTSGMLAYDKSTTTLQLYDGSSWVDVAVGTVGVTDHGALTGLGDDDHSQYHNDARGDARYLQLTGGTVTGLATFANGIDASHVGKSDTNRYTYITAWPNDGNWIAVNGGNGYLLLDGNYADDDIYLRSYNNTGTVNIGAGNSNTLNVANGSINVNGTGYAASWSVGTGSSANSFAGGSNYWRPQDVYGNSYFDINSGQFYVDSDTYYFRNRASANSLVIDSAGNGTFTSGVYASDWFRAYGEKGLYSQSYGQHFYPDSGGFLWDIDGPLRVRSGYEGGIEGYLGYHDVNGFGFLHSGGSWWLNTQNNYKHLVIGGSQATNAYNSQPSIRLMFGGGDADAQGNYYIGTNLENYGGNYTKLDMFWHTGVRIAAMQQYGGIRMYGSITGGSLSAELFSVGKGNGDVRATNSMHAYAYYGHSNIASTGNAIHTPNGIYSTGTNWLYGKILTNGNDIGQSSQRIGQVYSNGWLRTVNQTGWYNDTYGGGMYQTDANYVRVYASKGLETNKVGTNLYNTAAVYINSSSPHLSFHPGGQAPQLRVGYNNNTVYFRNWPDTGWCVIEAVIINHSSRVDKQDITDFANRPSALSSGSNGEFGRSGTDLVRQLRPRHYRWDWDKNMRQLPLSPRRTRALERLNEFRQNRGLGEFISDESWHVCGRDCDGTETDPCWWVKDWNAGYFGFIAEEVGDVAPEAGRLDSKTGELSGLDPLAISAIIVASLQEVLDRLDVLEGA